MAKKVGPDPLSFVSALLLYVFLGMFGSFAGAMITLLRGVMDVSPRLAWLGLLALFASPVAFVALAHHAIHGVLDSSEKRKGRGVFPDLLCWWGGVYAWGVIFLSSVVSLLAVLVVSPPDMDGALASALVVAERFAWMQNTSVLATVQTFAWLGVASFLYELERRVKARVAVTGP